jgi:hypothetical protein
MELFNSSKLPTFIGRAKMDRDWNSEERFHICEVVKQQTEQLVSFYNIRHDDASSSTIVFVFVIINLAILIKSLFGKIETILNRCVKESIVNAKKWWNRPKEVFSPTFDSEFKSGQQSKL